MTNYKRGYCRRKGLNWSSPRFLKKPNDREHLDRPKSRKKPCKVTKGLHDFQVSEFKIRSHGKFKLRVYPRGYTFFHLQIDYRCVCGEKGGWDKSIFIF